MSAETIEEQDRQLDATFQRMHHQEDSGLPLLERIRTRRARLHKAAADLKTMFVGLDARIDEIIRNMEVWYVMPEVITRPVIICLWGMTGVGKTDLVRKLVKLLGLSNRFLEIQLCNEGSSAGYHSSINSALGCSNLEPKSPGVLLLDEVQRFRTVSDEGKELMDSKFQDVWMLLSDGKFSGSTDKEDIMRILFENVLWSVPSDRRDEDDEEDDEEEKKKKIEAKQRSKYRQSYYDAKRLKRALRLADPVEEIMLWDQDNKMKVAIEKLEDQSTYEGDDYSKLLIFISGNLDEAYRMSGQCGEANIDADVMHAFSLNINLVSIKNALTARFKPEQIARFGNTHVIYPSLSRNSYQTIIARRVESILLSVQREHGITINVKPPVTEFLYRNGVFPSQGVRPLFSTISSYLENAIPSVVLFSIERGVTDVDLTYNDNHLVATVGDEEVRIRAEGAIDVIKKENEFEKRVVTSVHEAGHAVLYAKLLHVIPTQIVSNTSSERTEGFIGVHTLNQSVEQTQNLLVVLMGGIVAEEMVFGAGGRTSGASGDIGHATTLAARGVRDWGWFGVNSRVKAANQNGGDVSNNNNSKEINDLIERMITEAKVTAQSLLEECMPLFSETCDTLVRNGEIDAVAFQTLCLKHGLNTRIVDPKQTVFDDYIAQYERFFKTALEANVAA